MSDLNCRKCRDTRYCPGTEYYDYEDIKFCRPQVFWILQNEATLSLGLWPTAPLETAVRSDKTATEATFAKAIRIIAEVRIRLDKTGWRGTWLRKECKDPKVEKMDYLSDEAKEALDYISGWRRPRRPFRFWLKDRHYEQKRKIRECVVIGKRR